MKRKTLLGITLLGLFAFGIGGLALASFDNQVPIVAMAEDVPSDTTSEETPISDEASVDDESFIEEAYNTYLVPILGTVSVASIGSAVLSIAVAFFNRKANKKNIIETKTNINNALIVVEALATSVKILLSAIEQGNAIAEETKQAFIVSTKELLAKIALLTGKTEELNKLKPVLITLAEIQGKIAVSSKELVASGIGESISKLVEQVKYL